MSNVLSMPSVDHMALQAIAQNSAGIQAIAQQILTLAGEARKATVAAQQAVTAATEAKAEVDALRGQVNDIDRKLRERVFIDGTQKGTLYQAVHDRAGWAAQHHPDEPFKTHIIRIWNKIKRDLVVSQYGYILEKDYDYAMRAALSYPGFGRNWTVK